MFCLQTDERNISSSSPVQGEKQGENVSGSSSSSSSDSDSGSSSSGNVINFLLADTESCCPSYIVGSCSNDNLMCVQMKFGFSFLISVYYSCLCVSFQTPIAKLRQLMDLMLGLHLGLDCIQLRYDHVLIGEF